MCKMTRTPPFDDGIVHLWQHNEPPLRMQNLKFKSSIGPKSKQHKDTLPPDLLVDLEFAINPKSRLIVNKTVRYIDIHEVYQFYFGTNGNQPKCASRFLTILTRLITRFPLLSPHPFMSSTDPHSDMEPWFHLPAEVGQPSSCMLVVIEVKLSSVDTPPKFCIASEKLPSRKESSVPTIAFQELC